MNPVVTCRDFTLQNYYARRIQRYVPSQCKHESIYISEDYIQTQFHKQLTLFAVDKMALVPCMLAEPEIFFIAAPVAFVVSTVASIALEVRSPSQKEEKKNWKDYFESTAILHDTTAKCLFIACMAVAVVNSISSLIFPSKMVWYNAIFVGLSVGFITGKVVIQKEYLHHCLRPKDPTLTEPLINEV